MSAQKYGYTRMDETTLFGTISLAFTLGIMHALDADHIMAVTGLSNTATHPNCASNAAQACLKKRWLSRGNPILLFCLRWALGHGISLMALGALVLALGAAIPVSLSKFAEYSVGFILIALGMWILWDLWNKHAHLHFHQHHNLPMHAHWHTHTGKKNHALEDHAHKHGPVLVGILHGTAGSAPLLALIPMERIASPALGMMYLASFSIGVVSSMLLFSGLLTQTSRWLIQHGNKAMTLARGGVASSAILFGGYLLFVGHAQ